MMIVVTYALTWLVPPRSRWTQKARWRVGLAIAMAIAGITHLASPTPFLQHLPLWVPLRSAVVVASGLVEIAFGVALLVRTSWRPTIGLALAAFLVAVFPANIYVAVAGIDVQGQPDGIYAWIRLLFQPLYVWLALWTTGGLDITSVRRLHRRGDVIAPIPAGSGRREAG
ncbi:MAG TPA: hypothetical protein VMM13_15005 [Euzebya sp.]|nr:hypothetical protein [Euzebya sp.]